MAITNGYATLTEVKAAMRIPNADTADDSAIETAIETASRDIDAHCERHFYSVSATRVFAPHDPYYCVIDDLVSLTTLQTSTNGTGWDATWTATDYQLEPLNGVSGGIISPATGIRAIGNYLFTELGGEATVRVTGTFGWSAVPTPIRQATIILAQRQFKRYDSPLGVAGVGDLGVMRVSRIDYDVASLVSRYRRIRVA